MPSALARLGGNGQGLIHRGGLEQLPRDEAPANASEQRVCREHRVEREGDAAVRGEGAGWEGTQVRICKKCRLTRDGNVDESLCVDFVNNYKCEIKLPLTVHQIISTDRMVDVRVR